jgi:hypothetical protein
VSEQAHRHSGIKPADPETRVASNQRWPAPPVRKVSSDQSSSARLAEPDADEAGEPIRLASGELASTDNSSITDAALPPTASRTTPSQLRAALTEHGPTNQNSPGWQSDLVSQGRYESSLPGGTPAPGDGQAQVPRAEAPASLPPLLPTGRPVLSAPDGAAHDVEPVAIKLLPSLAQAAEPSDMPSAARESHPAPAAVGDVPAMGIAAGSAPGPVLTPVPSSSGLTQPVDPGVVPKAPASAPVIELETLPTSGPPPSAAASAEAGQIAHREMEDAVPASEAGTAPQAPPTSTAPSSFRANSLGAADDLPPLPANLDHGTTLSAATTESSAPSPVPPTPPRRHDNANELPPLPAELGTGMPPSSTPTLPPAPSAATEPLPLLPEAINDHPANAASESRCPVSPAGAKEALPPSLPSGSSISSAATDAGALAPKPGGESARALAVTPSGSPDPPTRNAALMTELLPASSGANQALPATVGTMTSTSPRIEPSAATKPHPPQEPAPASPSENDNAADPSAPPQVLDNHQRSVSPLDALLPDPPAHSSTLSPELQREVERIARQQDDDLRRQPQARQQPPRPSAGTAGSDLRTQTQLDISRAPSPAEARPIKAIPVPEDWVPLAPRNWSPQRKYWAAAATCHLPLYFQDPVLERYGHSVEQFVGPIGRFLTYPVDDPAQSTQRNQLLQPLFSFGLFSLQIAAWPYNLIMDPPWEAQYDLGYYRPGDNIPTDLHWLPLHGYGPPLRGSNY